MEKEIGKFLSEYFNREINSVKYLNDILILFISTKNMDFKDIGVALLIEKINLISKLEEKFNLKINDDEGYETISELINLIITKKNDEIINFIEERYYRKISEISKVRDFIVIHTFIKHYNDNLFTDRFNEELDSFVKSINIRFNTFISRQLIEGLNFNEFFNLVNIHRLSI